MQKRRESEYSHHKLSNHDLRRVAVEAVVDPRAVVRYLRGKPMNDHTRIHVERALVTCGFPSLVRPSAAADELAGAPKVNGAAASSSSTNGAGLVKSGASTPHPMLERGRR